MLNQKSTSQVQIMKISQKSQKQSMSFKYQWAEKMLNLCNKLKNQIKMTPKYKNNRIF